MNNGTQFVVAPNPDEVTIGKVNNSVGCIVMILCIDSALLIADTIILFVILLRSAAG